MRSFLILALCLPAALSAQEPAADTATAPAPDTAQTPPPDTAPAPIPDNTQVVDSVVVDTSGLNRASDLMARLDSILETILRMERSVTGLNPQELSLLRVRAVGYIKEMHRGQVEFLGLLQDLQQDSQPVDSLVEAFEGFLTTEARAYARSIDRTAQRADRLREQRLSTAPENLPELDLMMQENEARLDSAIAGQINTLEGADAAGLDATRFWDALDSFMVNRVEANVGRLQLAMVDRTRQRHRVRQMGRTGASEGELLTARTRLQGAETRVQTLVVSLYRQADLLDRRGHETARHRQLLIRATGEVTGDILDPKVFFGLVQDFLSGLWVWIKDNGPTMLTRLLILVGVTLLFRWGINLLWRLLRVTGLLKMHRLLADMTGRMIQPIGTFLGVVVGLSMLGVNPTHLVTGVGVAGIIIGLALQDSMANLAAGFFILMYRPYDVDDIVSAGSVVGTVKQMGLANTTIVTFDRKRLYVPNRKIWSDVIENHSAEPVRRVEALVKVGYDQDLDRAFGAIRSLLQEHEVVLSEPEPLLYIKDFGDSWLDVVVWCYVPSAKWWATKASLPRLIRLKFEEEGIEIPVPSREIVTPGRSDSDDVAIETRAGESST
jgi:small conductance mechanosensitive channel